jgi:hypothetical protein
MKGRFHTFQTSIGWTSGYTFSVLILLDFYSFERKNNFLSTSGVELCLSVLFLILFFPRAVYVTSKWKHQAGFDSETSTRSDHIYPYKKAPESVEWE